MSPRARARAGPHTGFPRASGDEPDRLRTADFYSQFSPRERG